MGQLRFRCPNSGRTIDSGVHTDEASLAKVRFLSVKLYCPVCNTTHLMRAGDGEVDTIVLPQAPPLAAAASSISVAARLR
jgi:hypothetical protein